tara:strand:+ start:213 stop:332 length:120 start_codon:yes stop_codon:yes gene_type:complete
MDILRQAQDERVSELFTFVVSLFIANTARGELVEPLPLS